MSCSIESLLISFVFRAAFRLPVFFLCKADLSERFPVPDFTIDSSKTKSFPGFISSVRFFVPESARKYGTFIGCHRLV
jgi:hypothetical protein